MISISLFDITKTAFDALSFTAFYARCYSLSYHVQFSFPTNNFLYNILYLAKKFSNGSFVFLSEQELSFKMNSMSNKESDFNKDCIIFSE